MKRKYNLSEITKEKLKFYHENKESIKAELVQNNYDLDLIKWRLIKRISDYLFKLI
jgi:hypothetical protein